MENEDELAANRTNNVRRSRAERARLEIERRHRSSSRGSDRSGSSQTAKHTSTSNADDGGGSGSARNSNRGSYHRDRGRDRHGHNVHSSAGSNAGGSEMMGSAGASNTSSTAAASSASGNRNAPSPLRARYEKYEKMGVRPKRTNDLSPTSRMIRQQQQYKQNQNQHGQGQGQPQHPEGHSQGQGPGQGTQRPTNQNQMQHDAGPSKVQTQTYEDNRQMQQQKKYSISMQQQQQQQNQNQHQSSFTNYQQHQANQMQQQQHQKQMQQPQKHQQRQQQQKQKQASMQTHNRQRPASVSTKQTSGGSASTDMSQSKTATTPLPSSFPIHPQTLSVESPLPPLVQRALGDRSYEKRKNAALEVEALVKSLAESASASNSTTSDSHKMISSLIHILSKDFCPSMNVHFRKGGLIGLAATAIGLNPQQLTSAYLEFLIKPVLICFDDPEPRVRYYACESLYNVVKVARESVLPYFNIIFEGVATVLADTDDEVRDGASLLDRLVKDIVTESEAFSVEKFLPLLQNYIRRTNPYLRQLVVGWITVLDGIPDVCMLDYLPDFLDGLFNMLSDSNLEIRQAADSALSDFLREIRESAVVEFGPIVSILVFQCESKERLNRLTSITWLSELIHHPDSGGDALLPYHADVLGAILHCISDQEVEIRKVSERSNSDLLTFVRDTDRDFELRILLETLTKELTGKDDVPTKMAVLKWINMLLEKRRRDMDEYISKLMPALLQLLSDQSDGVVLLTVQVLSRISLSEVVIQGSASKEKVRDEDQFEMVIKSILELFKADRRLLETRSSLIVRRLCVLLNAKSVYLVMADIISSYDLSPESGDSNTLEFVATMVQTLNLILLTASELNNLRQLLEESFSGEAPEISSSSSISKASAGRYQAKNEGARVFAALFHCWSNNPVSTFSLCLLARAYDLAFALVKKFSELEVTVGLLMQLDRLIGLIESPIFVHIRLQLLDVEAPFHTYLLKSCYGLLMLLPQSDAYRSLNDRLTSVCNLRDNLGVRPSITAAPSTGVIKNEESSIYNAGLDAVDLLDRFDEVMAIHRKARSAIQQKSIMHQQQDHINERNSTVGNVLRVAIVNTPSSRPPDQMPIGMGPSMRQR